MELNPAYGHRRVAMALKINRKRARRVMRKYGIKPYKRKARWTKKKDWGQPDAGYPNLVKGACPIKPNVFFVGDFTRLIWNRKVFYLATFMDVFNREVVGWSLSSRHTKELVIGAFLDALKTNGKPLIVHTDQGSEYKSQDYQELVNSLGTKLSMSAKASPWENAYQESFYDNFKTDLGLEFERFESIGEFIEAIHRTIKYYNYHRIHTRLKMPPAQFKSQFLARKS
jgi:putative transposase